MTAHVTPATDHSLDASASFGSLRWVAMRLGRSPSWVRSNMLQLRRTGFPPPDPLVGLYPKDRVDRWIAQRAGVSDDAQITDAAPEIDYDHL